MALLVGQKSHLKRISWKTTGTGRKIPLRPIEPKNAGSRSALGFRDYSYIYLCACALQKRALVRCGR